MSDNSNFESLLHRIMETMDRLCYAGNLDEALRLYRRTEKQFPAETRLTKKIAVHLIDAEKYEDALTIMDKGPDHPIDGDLLTLRGQCFQSLGRLDEAEAACRKALSFVGETAPIQHLRALCDYDRGDRNNAEIGLFRAIEIDASFGIAYFDLGLLYIESGRPEEGLDLLTKGFIRSSQDTSIATRFHDAVSEIGDISAAQLLFEEQVKRFPGHKTLNYLYIDLLLQQEKKGAAMSAIEAAICRFGFTDGIISPALTLRKQLGPMRIDSRKKDKHTISLCMITKNEEHSIARCLFYAKPLVDEIVLVDTGSTDRTIDIATCYGARVFRTAWNDDFSEARNASIGYAEGAWVLVLDADEVVSLADHVSLLRMVGTSTTQMRAFRFETRNYTNDVGLEGWQKNDDRYPHEQAGSGWCPSRKVRLFPRNENIRFVNPVHELVEPALRSMGCVIEDCKIPVHHYGKLEKKLDSAKKKDYYRLGIKKSRQKKGDLSAIVELAIQAGEVGEYEKAVKLWTTVIKQAPEFPQAYFNLSYVFIQLERYRDSAKAAQHALEIDPGLKEARLNLALCQIRMGNFEDAVDILQRFLAEFDRHPMAMGLMSITCFLLDQPEKGFSWLRLLEAMAFDCKAYLSEHAEKLLSIGNEVDAAKLIAAMQQNPRLCTAAGLPSHSVPRLDVLQGPVPTIIQYQLNDTQIDSGFFEPMVEIEKLNWRQFNVCRDAEEADFIIFPYPLDRLYQHLGHEKTIAYLNRLPEFEKREDRFVFFLRDDIGRTLGLRSIIYRVNHSRHAMDINSITLPYFFDDIYRGPIRGTLKYHVNFVGALVTHVFRAYMLLPFLSGWQLSAFDELLSSLDRLLAARRDENDYAILAKTVTDRIGKLFPLEVSRFGIHYYFNTITDQFPRLSEASRKCMKDGMLNTMHQSTATLCPRGVGAQSIRFFETMALGRLPIVISDNYIFPLHYKIDYDRFLIRIKEHRIADLSSEMARFFSQTTAEEVSRMGMQAREAWLEYFAPCRFESYLHHTLTKVLEKKRCLNAIR